MFACDSAEAKSSWPGRLVDKCAKFHCLYICCRGCSSETDVSHHSPNKWEQFGDTEETLRAVRTSLRKAQELQDAPLEGFLLKKVPEALYTRKEREYAEQIATLEHRIRELEHERVTSHDLLAFSNAMLAGVSFAWQSATVEQRQRVQNLLFPGGLYCHPEKGILNSENG